MLFKNAQIYRLADDWNPSANDLNAALARKQFSQPGSQDFERSGWVVAAPDCELGDMAYSKGRCHLVCLQREQKILPPAVVKQIADERAAEIFEQQGFRPGRKQMKELRELVMSELLPKAFSRKRKTFALILPGMLIVDSATSSRAEELIEHLRHALDAFPVTMFRTDKSPVSAMSSWLADSEAPDGFTIDQDCTLRSVAEDRREVAYRRGLNEDQARENLEVGCLPVKLAMTFDDRISFVLTEKFEVKRIQYLDIVTEPLRQQEDADAVFASEFAINVSELQRLVSNLVDALGGEYHHS